MMTALDHPLVRDYLARLHVAVARLSEQEARELEGQIREHLTDALGPEPRESKVREVLDRLGDPAEVVDAAGGRRDESGAPRSDSAWREVGALVLLVGSGVLFWLWPVAAVMWVVGLVLLVLSRRWTVGEKLWGALVLGVSWWLALGIGAVAWLAPAQVCETDAAGNTVCSGGGDGGMTAAGGLVIGFLVFYLVISVWTVIRLARAAARR